MSSLEERVRSCRACPLAGKGKSCPGVGMRSARVMVVGPTPGIEEGKEGVAFIGHAGQFLDACLRSVGIFPKEVWYTYIVKHFPGRSRGGEDCPAWAIEACKQHLLDEIEYVQPELIVAVGAVVMKFFGIKGGIKKNSGQVFDTDYGKVLVILSPAGLMRKKNMGNVPMFRTSLNSIRTFLNGGLVPPAYTGEQFGRENTSGLSVSGRTPVDDVSVDISEVGSSRGILDSQDAQQKLAI